MMTASYKCAIAIIVAAEAEQQATAAEQQADGLIPAESNLLWQLAESYSVI